MRIKRRNNIIKQEHQETENLEKIDTILIMAGARGMGGEKELKIKIVKTMRSKGRILTEGRVEGGERRRRGQRTMEHEEEEAAGEEKEKKKRRGGTGGGKGGRVGEGKAGGKRGDAWKE